MAEIRDLSGTVLKSYEMMELIGAGGFGAVYRAVQPAVGREVAVKVILPRFANQREFIKRFETEAQLVARLEHPHIVPLYDYWREPNSAYLVMRYLRGGSLRDSIDENGPWNPGSVILMINQIAAALTFAHRNGVVHRDLKTDNILIDEEGNCYLTDFGIAKDLGGESITQDSLLGTPAYLSPEQIRGDEASPRSDVYALGIMTYETLTAVKPFADKTPATVLYKQLHDPLPSLEEKRPDLINPELDLVLQRATSKDPDMRFETAIEFARALNDVVRDSTPGMPALAATSTMDLASITQQEVNLGELSNPYKGLRAFQQADTDDFYGREELVSRLIDEMAVHGQNQDFLAVVGPSGSGKSSVVKAGLLPRILGGALGSEIDWYVAEMVPGTHPMEEVEAALLAVAANEMPGMLEQLREDERGLVRVARRLMPDENAQLVLFIDQFEEIFTLVEDEERREHFMYSILEAALDERSRIKIIVTIRADFYDRPLLYSRFGELIRQRTELVLPLNNEELEASIVKPARRAGLQVEPALLAAMVRDVNEQPGALPLLQYALTELYQRRDGNRLTLDAYRDIGGTTGALARRADELYRSFTDDEQEAAKQLFLRLVSLGEGTEDTRRRVFQSELLTIGRRNLAMRRVIDQFGKYRLLTFDNDPQTRSSTVEIAHEALIRQWAQLQEWLQENREVLRLQRRLSIAADEWESARRDPSFLARGSRLQQFEELISAGIALSIKEQQYIQISTQARDEREQAEREQAERERRQQERVQRLQRTVAIVSFVLFLIAAGFAITAYFASQDAVEQAEIARNNEATALSAQERAEQEAQRAATAAAIAQDNEDEARSLALAATARNALTQENPQLALLLALEARDAYQPVQSEVLRTLYNTAYAPGPRYRFMGNAESAMGVAVSADGRHTLSAGFDGSVRIWDNSTGQEVLVVQVDTPLTSVAINPAGTAFAATGTSGDVFLWNFPDGTLQFTLSAHTGTVFDLSFSPNGRFLATGGEDRVLRIWGTASGTLVRSLPEHPGAILALDYSPDGSQILTGTGDENIADDNFDLQDRTARLWDVESGEMLLEIAPGSGFIRAVDYAPDGEMVALAMYDTTDSGTVRVYDTENGTEIARFFAHTAAIPVVTFSPDGENVLSAGWDRVIRIFNIERGVEIASYSGFSERVLDVAYTPDGDRIAFALGNVGDSAEVANFAQDSEVWLWDLVAGDQVGIFREHEEWLWAIDLNPDGNLVASAGGPLFLPEVAQGDEIPFVDTLVRVWDLNSGEVLQELELHRNTVDSVRFHPDGRRLLSAGWDRLIVLWDIETGERLNLYREHDDRVHMVRFAPDGETFASVSRDGRALVWDTESAEVLLTLDHDGRPVNGVDYSPDGSLIATSYGNRNGTGEAVGIVLWDAQTGEEIRRYFGHTGGVNEVRFSPDGTHLFSSSWDTTVRMWETATGDPVRTFTGHGGHTFGLDISSDGELLLTTSQDTTVRLWDIATGEELHQLDNHTDWIQEVVFTPDDRRAVSAGQDNTARHWRIDRNAEQVVEFAQENRYIREFTCAERDLYRMEPCELTARPNDYGGD